MVGLLKAITKLLNDYWTTILGSVSESVNNGNGDTHDMDPAALLAILSKGTFASESVCYFHLSCISDRHRNILKT